MVSPDDLPMMMTMQEVSEVTGYPFRTVRRMVAEGILPSIKLKRLVRIPTGRFLEVLAENQRARAEACIKRAHNRRG